MNADQLTIVLQYLFFFALILYLLRRILYSTLFVRKWIEKKWATIQSKGISGFTNKKLPWTVLALVAYFWGYKFAELKWFWLSWFILNIILNLAAYGFAIRFGMSDAENLSEDRIRRDIKGSKIFAVTDFLILILWIYSWKHLFIF